MMAGLLDEIQNNQQWSQMPFTPMEDNLSSAIKMRWNEINTPHEIKPLTVNDVLMSLPISPLGKTKLIESLAKGLLEEKFTLGKLTDGQLRQLNKINNSNLSSDVVITPKTFDHIYERRITQQNFTPEEVGKFAEEAMRPIAKIQMGDKGLEIINPRMWDKQTNKIYDAKIPLGEQDNSLLGRSVIPKGLPARKTKPTE